MDSDGLVEAVDGIDNPILTRYSPTSGSFTDTTFPGWLIYGTSFSGKLATYQNFTFVADNSLDGQMPPPGGVLRLDRSTGAIIRLQGHAGVDDVVMGLDGRLYALYESTPGASGATNVDVYDPVTGAWLYAIDLPLQNFSITGIAVDQSGEILAVGAWFVYRLSADGTVEATAMPVPEFEILDDIDVDETGRVIIISDKANVLVGTTALTSFTTFAGNNNPAVLDWAAFITFARHIPAPAPPPIVPSGTSKLPNISTRLEVKTVDQVGIAGFIITGTGEMTVVVRAIGPSLANYGVDGTLQDPTLELRDSSGALLASNDNWGDTQASEIEGTGLAPYSELESAIVRTLSPGQYTAIIQGKDATTGVGLVEAYGINPPADTKFGNISTRGFVDQGQNVMIGGFIISGQPSAGDAAQVVVRGLGPSLTQSGVSDVLPDPTLELHNANGWLVASNDDWKDTQSAEIEATGLAPTDDREAAIVTTLLSGAYTAILRGKDTATGNGLIEVYDLQ